MRKAYGYPLTEDRDNCLGMVVDEYGNFLGNHTSSSYYWLQIDLESHAKGYEYSFVNFVPGPGFVVPVLLNEIYRLKEELKAKTTSQTQEAIIGGTAINGGKA